VGGTIDKYYRHLIGFGG